MLSKSIMEPYMGENEENEDVRIATSLWGFKKAENQGFENLRIDDY